MTFLPFWTLMGYVLAVYLFCEGLRKLGILKDGKSK